MKKKWLMIILIIMLTGCGNGKVIPIETTIDIEMNEAKSPIEPILTTASDADNEPTDEEDTFFKLNSHDMNAPGNDGSVFYNDGHYFFCDPRRYTENPLNDYHKTDEAFITFEQMENMSFPFDGSEDNYIIDRAFQSGNYVYDVGYSFDEEQGNFIYIFRTSGDDARNSEKEILITREAFTLHTFNVYKNLLYYSEGTQLFTYDLIAMEPNPVPLIELENKEIIKIDICGEVLLLKIILSNRNMQGYAINSGAASYIADLDGSNLREIIIPQHKDTFQTYVYDFDENSEAGVSVPGYWHMFNDDGSLMSNHVMFFSPWYDSFMYIGLDTYFKTVNPFEHLESIKKASFETYQGLEGKYTVDKGESLLPNDDRDLYRFDCLISYGEDQFRFQSTGSYGDVEELKPILLEIAKRFEVLY